MSKIIVTFDPTISPFPFAPLLAALLVNQGSNEIAVEWKQGVSPTGISLSSSPDTTESHQILLELAQLFPAALGFTQENSMPWLEFTQTAFKSSKFADLQASFNKVDEHLKLRTFLTSEELSVADIAVWSALRTVPIWNKNFKDGNKTVGTEIFRWFGHVASQDVIIKALAAQAEQVTEFKERKKDQGSFDIGLDNAVRGKVVTRFPPEPSGYLHIGHAKAVLLNQHFAQKYEGKLIIRFDDTNPDKENCEFEDSILEDLELLGVKGDIYTRTSDYFDVIYNYAIQIIKDGLAYVDDTPQEQMREERFSGIPSKNRNNGVEENLRRFEEMTKGSKEGLVNCLRAKISMDNPNKAMRDPVIYRCNLTPHHRIGDKWKVYPTYDFACPIVDSLEGVTHALRTDEYHDRNDQYYWIIDALRLKKPHIWDYSRLNFIYTLLSKRKLGWFVNNGKVSGWDDPRFPTVRGIRRRGLTVEALREYILMQGASKNAIMLEWDKIWAVNKKVIDPIAPRYTALDKNNLCKVILADGPAEPYTSKVMLHKKNPELGEKDTSYSSMIFIEQEDAKTLEESEEVTLMDWGNIVIEKITKEEKNGDKLVLQVIAKMNLEGDFKKTKKKLTWLSPDPTPLISVAIHDYDYLINKKKLEENDKLEDCLTPVTEFITKAIGDSNLASLKKGQIIQLERKGFFICDRTLGDNGAAELKLIAIPDGKAKTIASKATPNQVISKNGGSSK